MISFGIKRKKIKEGFLTTCSCNNCGKTEENKIVVSCTTFVLGQIFWPWIWWAWNKEGYIECDACKKHYIFAQLDGDILEVATFSFNEIKIPKRFYFLPAAFAIRILLFLMPG